MMQIKKMDTGANNSTAEKSFCATLPSDEKSFCATLPPEK